MAKISSCTIFHSALYLMDWQNQKDNMNNDVTSKMVFFFIMMNPDHLLFIIFAISLVIVIVSASP